MPHLAGAAIDLVGLDPNADPTRIPAHVIDGLGFAYGPGALLLVSLPIGLLWGYDIDPEKHMAILREIANTR